MTDRKQKIYRKKSVRTPVTFGFAVHPAETPHQNPSPAASAKPAERTQMPVDLQREADRLLLARYAPPSVVVDDNLDIVQIRGHTAVFLELPTGRVTLNLLKMARSGLLAELQSAIDEARTSGIDAVRTNVQFESEVGTTITAIRVTSFKIPVRDKPSFLVVFEPPEGAAARTSAEVTISPLSDDERSAKDRQIAQVRQELAASKEYLQSIIEALESTNEELQSANEEIQSGNEELQSSNEELQTSKEELESANEELHTVNEEMQHRNEMLTQLNNDLNNLLNSVNLPMVMVGPDLGVRRFTPLASKMLGLTATDVGRPITRLRLKIDVENLEHLMLDVISEVQPSQHRVRSEDGQWCELRLTPYRTSDNRIDGVVLSILSAEEQDNSRDAHGRRQKQRAGAAAKGKQLNSAGGNKKPNGPRKK